MTRAEFKAHEGALADEADRRYRAESSAYNAQKREGRGR